MTDSAWRAPQPVADAILDWLHDGGSLLKFCEQPGNPKRRTIYDWVERDPEFAAQFARARESGAGVLVDRAQDVADDGSNDTYQDDEGNSCTDHDVVARSKLRVDTLFKRAACFAPRLYGTKVQVGGDGGQPIKVDNNISGPTPPPTVDLLQSVRKLAELAEELVAEPGE